MRFRAALIILLALLLLGFPAAAAPPVQDICLGNGTPGPYALSWKRIQPGSERVGINGLPQIRGLDYTLDADSGTITFTRSLPTRSAVAVTYECDPKQAQRSAVGQTFPLAIDLLRGEHGYFAFHAVGKTGAEAQSGLTLGVGMGWHGMSNAQVSSRVFYAPLTTASDTENAAPAKRLGLSVAGSREAGKWALFSFGFSRAGIGLGDTGDASLNAGQQRLTLSSRLTPTRQIQALLDYSQSRPTDNPLAATAVKTSLALTMTPNAQTQMQANLAQSVSGTGEPTQTLALSVNAKPKNTFQVSASYRSQDAPGTTGDSQTLDFKTTLTPTKTLSFETSAMQTRSGAAMTNQQAVGFSLNPLSAFKINAALALRQTGSLGQETLGTAAASVSGLLRPVSFLEFSGSYKNRMAPETDFNPNDQFDTSIAKVSLSPVKSVHLVGTYAQNPDNGGDTLQRLAQRGISVETSLGALALSGGCDWFRRYDTPDVEQAVHADLGLRFSAATQVTFGFQSRQNVLIPSAATAYTVGLTHSLGDRFSLSVKGNRQQSIDAKTADYDASANLGMKF